MREDVVWQIEIVSCFVNFKIRDDKQENDGELFLFVSCLLMSMLLFLAKLVVPTIGFSNYCKSLKG